jgi:hypothetical protein
MGDPTIIQFNVVRLDKSMDKEMLDIRPAQGAFGTFGLSDTSYEFNDPFLITTNETVSLPLYVRVRTDIQETDYRYGLMIETVPPQSPEGEVSLNVHGSLILPLLFQVTSDAHDKKDFRVTLFDVRPQYELPFFNKNIPLFHTSTPIPVVLRAQNGARHSVELRGSVAIQNTFGSRDVYSIAPQRVPAETDIILHGNDQEEICAKDTSSPLCDDDNTLLLSNLPTGYYTASATVYDHDKSRIISNQMNFLVLPIWWIVFSFTLALSILVGIVSFFLKRKQIESYLVQKRRQKRRSSLKP